MNSGDFASDDLVKVDESNLVILASGSPLMRIVCVEGGNALCKFIDDSIGPRLLPIVCLRKLSKLNDEDLAEFS